MNNTLSQTANVVLGSVCGVHADGRPLISWRRADRTGVPAATVWLSPSIDWSANLGLRVVLGFEDGDAARPVVLGAMSPPKASTTPRVIHLQSSEELVLECGQAKIALRADGRVSVIGGYLVSESTGPNKIRGGSVQIN